MKYNEGETYGKNILNSFISGSIHGEQFSVKERKMKYTQNAITGRIKSLLAGSRCVPVSIPR